MRLISCHIENFGKLQDISVDFTEGLNVFCEENGWGKSTFAAFLRAMFYGLEGERRRRIEDNERRRYQPWQGGVFGGQLVFETGGKTYEIARIFREKESQDVFELRDAKTNLPSSDFSEKIGEELFRLNRESFLRTVFVGQNDCLTAVTDDVNARIGKLTDNTNDMNHYEAAREALTALLNRMNPNRVTGSLNKRSREITRLERVVLDGNSLSEQMRREEERLKQEQEQNDRQQSAWEHVQQQCIRYRMNGQEQEEFGLLQRLFAKGIPLEEEIEEQLAAAYALLRGEKSEESEPGWRRGLGLLIIVIGIVGLLASKHWAYLSFLALGAVLLLLKRKPDLSTEQADHGGNMGVREFLAAYPELYASDLHDPQQCIEALHDLQRAAERYEQLLNQNELYEEACRQSEKLQRLQSERNAMPQGIREIQNRMEYLKEQYDQWEDAKQQLAQMRRDQAEEWKKYENVGKARALLEQAKESMTQKYAAPILRQFGEYYERITGQSAAPFHMDANVNVSREEYGLQRSAHTLSAGCQDLIYFCLRIALADAMFSAERPMLILDDPFVNLDDEKLARAKVFLRQLEKKYQILYFTCREDRTLSRV